MIESIRYFDGNSFSYSSEIEKLTIEMEPDSVVAVNIHLLEVLPIVSVTEDWRGNDLFSLYFKKGLLSYEIDLPVKTASIQLTITNLKGTKVFDGKISENKGQIETQLDSGIYFVQLKVNSLSVSVRKITLN